VPDDQSTIYDGGVPLLALEQDCGVVPETILAIATAPEYLDSFPAAGAYEVGIPQSGILNVVGFNPSAISESNDFPVQLSGTAGATICYTLDGGPAGCDDSGICTGGLRYGPLSPSTAP